MAGEDSAKRSREPAEGLARWWSLVFLLLISIPLASLLFPGSDGFGIETQGRSLREKLSSVEDGFTGLPLFEQMRVADQRRVVRFSGLGNARVVVGARAWLHYRPDLDAVIGKGPFYVEPPSVARDPGLSPWNRPGPIIRQFHEQLEERGIELWLIPVPTKSMGVSLDGESRRLVPDEYGLLLENLEESGVKVFDPSPLLIEPGSYLRTDTHWTPEAMSRVAESLAETVSGSNESRVEFETISGDLSGDLMQMLMSDDSGSSERVALLRPLGDGPRLPADPASPWVLLGDSFVNIYEDPSLGFPNWKGDRIGAGFASHLAAFLGQPLHVIAVNGGGATGVRKSFAALPDEVVRSKEKVFWVLSARDLLLSEIPGRRAGIEWEPVEFRSEGEVTGDHESGLVITATLRERSTIVDPNTSPYTNAVFSTLFDEVEVESGEYGHPEVLIYFWAFRNRVPEGVAGMVPGKRYRLALSLFPGEGPVASAQLLDDIFRPDLERFFAESFEEIE